MHMGLNWYWWLGIQQLWIVKTIEIDMKESRKKTSLYKSLRYTWWNSKSCTPEKKLSSPTSSVSSPLAHFTSSSFWCSCRSRSLSVSSAASVVSNDFGDTGSCVPSASCPKGRRESDKMWTGACLGAPSPSQGMMRHKASLWNFLYNHRPHVQCITCTLCGFACMHVFTKHVHALPAQYLFNVYNTHAW